jgi:Lon protease-like protein
MANRFSPADAPSVIPVFPLPGALLLPRGRLPLNIFEPRYLVMVDDAMKSEHRLIGMVQPQGDTDTRGDKPLFSVGCAGRITTLSETDDGRYLIGLSGVSRFRVVQEVEGFAPYRQAQVSWDDFILDIKTPKHDDENFNRDSFLALVERYFQAKSLDTDWDAFGKASEETIVNALCMICPFTEQEKQALLEAEDLTARRDTLTTLLMIDSAGDEGSGGMQ